MQNLLLIDTSMDACSAALLWQGKITERFEICPQQHSQRILPMIDSLLGEAGITLSQLDGLGFGHGPGSFTGVRIATGIMQGLALGTSLPVVGLSTLATMARQCAEHTDCDNIITISDARMNEVYIGHYRLHDGIMEAQIAEQVLSPQMALEQVVNPIAEQYVNVVGCGNGWPLLASVPAAVTQIYTDIIYPRAKWMFSLAEQAFSDGLATDAADIQPVYVRDTVTWKKLPGRE